MSAGKKVWRLGWWSLLGVLSIGFGLRSTADELPMVRPRAQDLVQQLGVDQYAARERASAELLKLGLAAIPALEEGRKNLDREIRYRCERLLVVMRDTEMDRRLESFLHNYDASRSYEMPGWSKFRKQFGDGARARAMFVEMYIAEPELLAAIERGVTATKELLPTRGQVLEQSLQAAPQDLVVGSVATLLFAASDEDVGINDQVGRRIANFCTHINFSNAITTGSGKEILRRLFSSWLLRREEYLSLYNPQLALKYEMREGLVLAERTLRVGAKNASVRLIAIQTITRFGDQSRMGLVETALDDRTVYVNWAQNNLMIQTQVRDVALAGLLLMNKQDPKQFGFERLQLDPQMLFNATTAGFDSDNKRDEALKKWTAFREMQKKTAE